ncbi:MAG: NAD(P)/FAD-dependent oxidoreductase [Fimbriimonadaceae bacterium]|nr:NAD(P)/FAD-dependent oxidoreductase [Fimbriimonadaceae bacterium]
MQDVLVVGDGPGGLSAALLLAKCGLSVEVCGVDGTPMHRAMVYNYLGIPAISGSEFQRVAREQVSAQGAVLRQAEVTGLAAAAAGFTVQTADGASRGRYLVLAIGSKRELVDQLGLARDEQGVVLVDRDGRTSLDKVYALGWTARKHKTQAVIAAGEGAAVALDILSIEKGKEFHDFDVVPQPPA